VNIQPIDLASLLRAVTWPLITIAALAVFRRPLINLVGILGRRVQRISFGGVSLDLSEISELKPHSLDAEIRQLDAGLVPQSGASSISVLLSQLQYRGQHDYIVIDLGSESSPRWLTSRLYLLALLITLIDLQLCLVFVETTGGVRKRFMGTASPNRVRWALARTYMWLESASAAAYVSLGTLQFDPATGHLTEWQTSQLMQQFLTNIRLAQPAPVNPPPDATEWISLPDGKYEHAKWLDGSRIERLLGNDLSGSYVVLLQNKSVSALADAVLGQRDRFVGVVESDKTFRGLVDRSAVLESLASGFLRQAGS